MTVERAALIAEDWLAIQPWGKHFQVTRVELEDDLAIVFWASKEGEMVAGNAPLLIESKTETVHCTGTGRRVQYYVENFRSTGDPHVEPQETLQITGWKKGAKKISAVTLLKESTDLGLVINPA